LAEPGDQTKDASQPWPDDRKLVDLGVLTLTKVLPDSAEAEKSSCFCRRTSRPVSSSPTIRCLRAHRGVRRLRQAQPVADKQSEYPRQLNATD
jgi:hypothetical protein